jgi:hypothetical protein
MNWYSKHKIRCIGCGQKPVKLNLLYWVRDAHSYWWHLPCRQLWLHQLSEDLRSYAKSVAPKVEPARIRAREIRDSAR